jgi:uncharacterized protein YbjQ (UPF0145 family)
MADARIARAKASGVRTSLLSVPGQLGVQASGLEAVGEVMGCIVEHIGFQGYGGCGIYGAVGSSALFGGYAGLASTVTSSNATGYAGFAPYVDALNAGWDGAIGRMLTEAKALGADGVVGVRLDEHALGNQNREFVALGTAVRSVGSFHLTAPFATTLVGQDVAKLVSRGYVPAAIIVAISVAVRHDDYQTRLAAATFGGNVEVPGYTDLVHHVRMDVRHVLERRSATGGADGAILSSPMGLVIHEIEVAENHRDHVAEASLVATTIARYSKVAVGAPSQMTLPLR